LDVTRWLEQHLDTENSQYYNTAQDFD